MLLIMVERWNYAKIFTENRIITLPFILSTTAYQSTLLLKFHAIQMNRLSEDQVQLGPIWLWDFALMKILNCRLRVFTQILLLFRPQARVSTNQAKFSELDNPSKVTTSVQSIRRLTTTIRAIQAIWTLTAAMLSPVRSWITISTLWKLRSL